MIQITGEQFCEYIKKDPSWANCLTYEVEVTSNVVATNIKGLELSQFLHFKGSTPDETPVRICADFTGCSFAYPIPHANFYGGVVLSGTNIQSTRNLKFLGDEPAITELIQCTDLIEVVGEFQGPLHIASCRSLERVDITVADAPPKKVGLDLYGSPNVTHIKAVVNACVRIRDTAIESTEDIKVLNAKPAHRAAIFSNNQNLKIATGTWPGSVWHMGSAVEIIDNLHTQNSPVGGKNYANLFEGCKHLKTIKNSSGTFVLSNTPLEIIRNVKSEMLILLGCTNIREMPEHLVLDLGEENTKMNADVRKRLIQEIEMRRKLKTGNKLEI